MRTDRDALASLVDVVEAEVHTGQMSVRVRTALLEAVGQARAHQAHVEAWGVLHAGRPCSLIVDL